jgi:hypothetical protein
LFVSNVLYVALENFVKLDPHLFVLNPPIYVAKRPDGTAFYPYTEGAVTLPTISVGAA